MRLAEITLPDFPQDAGQRLRAAGYKQIGDGSYAEVYQKPGSPYVLKLFSDSDKAFLAFVALAKAHPNPHFPVFRGQLITASDNYYALRMELLTEFPDNLIDPVLWPIHSYMFGIGKNPESYPFLQTSQYQEHIHWIEDHPSVKQACDLMHRYLSGQFTFDLKADNVMMRGDTIVFVDPVKMPFKSSSY